MVAQNEKKVNATIRKNEKFNSTEIIFDGIPSKETREALKALKFRWNAARKLWYGFASEAAVIEAIQETKEDCYTGKPVKAEEKQPKKAGFDKNALRAEYAKVWKKDSKMIDYCVNSTAAVANLPNGEMITIRKQKIETWFCFGEGSNGVTYEEAQRQAAHARTDFEHFKRKNMASFKSWIDAIERASQFEEYALAIEKKGYTGQTEDCKLARIEFFRLSKVLFDCGGSAYLEELPGKEITEAGSARKYRIATKEETKILLDAYKEAAAAHEKKVDSYLKRYGTSKVHAWTYWVDA